MPHPQTIGVKFDRSTPFESVIYIENIQGTCCIACRCREIDYPPQKYPLDNIVHAKSIRGDDINYHGGYDMDIPLPVKKVSPAFPLLLNARIEYTTTRLLSSAHYITCIKRQKRSRKVFTLKISHNNPNYRSMKTTTTNYL